MAKQLAKRKSRRGCLVWFFSLLMVLSIIGPIPAMAVENDGSHDNGIKNHSETSAEALYIDLRATGLAGDIFNESEYEVHAGEVDITINGEEHALDRHTAMGALVHYCLEKEIDFEITDDLSRGLFVNQIGDDEDDKGNWMYYVSASSPWLGAAEYELDDGDLLHFANFYLNLYSLVLSLDRDTIEVGESVTVTVEYTDGSGNTGKIEGADVFISDETDDWGSPVAVETSIGQTDADGKYSITLNEEGTFYPYAEWEGKSTLFQWPVASVDVGKKTVELTPSDSDWVKNGYTVLDALLKFQQDDGSFWWQEGTAGAVKMSTVDSLAALIDLAYGESARHKLGQNVSFDTEHEMLSRALDSTIAWYEENHNPPESWVGLPALWAAGENLNAAPWQANQDWRNTDPGFEADTSGNEHIHHIFKLLSVGENPADIWGGRNLFAELAAQQDENDGSFGNLGKHIWAMVALDVGKELQKDVGSWGEGSRRESAVEHLLAQQEGDGSFVEFSQLDDTGSSLLALSNYRGDADVEAAIDKAVAFLQGKQEDSGGFATGGEWGAENANSNAAVISGLVAVGEDLFIEENVIEVDDTPLKITIPEDTASSKLMTSPTEENGAKTATLPSIEVEAETTLGTARLSIPQDTEVTGAGSWDGSIKLPALKDVGSVNLSDGRVNAVIEVGFPDGQLDFDRPVRLSMPGQVGKSAGFTRGDVPVTEIERLLDEDSPVYAADNLSPGEAGKIDVNEDLVVWTMHFTMFVAYTPDSTPSPPNGSPSPSPPAESVTLSVDAKTIGKGDIISYTTVELEDGDTAYTVLQREADRRGISVSGSASYVSGIDGIYEFDHGPLSGWKYSVNGVFPSKGAGEYLLHDGDQLRWRYSTDGGEDLGMEIDDPAEEAKEEEMIEKDVEEIKDLLKEKADHAAGWILSHADLSEPAPHLDWSIFAVARAGAEVPEGYRELLINHVVESGGDFRLVTDYARLALAAASVGINPADLAGYDLLEKIYSSERMTNQGANGPAFALIALDALAREVPEDAPWIRERLVDWILKQQNRDGGFPLHKGGSGSVSEVDVTAMVLQALSNHQHRQEVEEAVERALDWLSDQQLSNGGFKSLDEENCESVSQVIIALTALDIDPLDERFVQNEGSLLSNLLSFAGEEDGGFAHIRGEESSRIATQQALMAITAYQRWLEGESGLFDLADRELDAIEEDTKEEEERYFLDEDRISWWAAEHVRKAWEYGLIKGVSETEPRFEPLRELTRAEITTMLVRLSGVERLEQPAAYFADVHPGDWYFGQVMTAWENGLVRGVADDQFAPDRAMTRQEIAVMLNRMLDLEASEVEPGGLKDLDTVSPWAESAVNAVFGEGVMVGDGDYFRPQDPVTREMAAVIVV